MPHLQRRGLIDSVADLSRLDLLRFCEGVNPYGDAAPNWSIAFDPEDRDRFRALIEKTGFVECGRVIDIGCGYGRMSIFLAEVNDFVHGIDKNAGALTIARGMCGQLGLDHATFDACCATDIAVESASFDGAWCFGVLSFVDRARGLAEIRRILKPGGRLFVGKYNSTGMILRKFLQGYREGGRHHRLATWARRALEHGPLHDGRPNWCTEDTIETVLHRHGFELAPDFSVSVYPPTTLGPDERAAFEDPETLGRRLETDERFVRELLDRHDEILSKLAGDLDLVAVKR